MFRNIEIENTIPKIVLGNLSYIGLGVNAPLEIRRMAREAHGSQELGTHLSVVFDAFDAPQAQP